jgi:hypothetical protein
VVVMGAPPHAWRMGLVRGRMMMKDGGMQSFEMANESPILATERNLKHLQLRPSPQSVKPPKRGSTLSMNASHTETETISRSRGALDPSDDPIPNLERLFSSIIEHVHKPDYMLAEIAAFFLAKSAVIWIKDVNTPDEFRVFASYNRPDFNSNESKRFFALNERTTVARKSFKDRNAIVGIIGIYPFDSNWLSQPHTVGLNSGSHSFVAILPIFDRLGTPYGTISLYSSTEFGTKICKYWRPVTEFLYSAVHHIIDETENIIGERDKICHEINRHINTAVELVRLADNFVQSNIPLGTNKGIFDSRIKDLKNELASIKLSNNTQKFFDAIILERRRSKQLNFQATFNSTARPLMANIDKRHVVLSPLLVLNGDVSIIMSESHFSHIVSNVVSNAIKYSAPPGVIRAIVDKDDSGSGVIFSISNISGGIDKSEWQKIWRDKYRGLKTRETRIKGEGLGLAIVRDICDAYNISYKYDERPRGSSGTFWSRFTFHFPSDMVRRRYDYN